MGSNIGNWYYPTTGDTSDGFTLAYDTTNNAPYKSQKCTDQKLIRLVANTNMNLNNSQGIVKCNTSLPNLLANYFGVYSDYVFHNYGKSWHRLA